VKQHTLRHAFIEYLPERLEEGTLYVSMQYATAAHKCCCGCGNDVYTPLSPTNWKLTFDGRTVSLFPSIGNWSFPCRSHYWIRKNTVEWAKRWSDDEIDAGRANDRELRQRDYREEAQDKKSTLWRRIRKRLGSGEL
jgi:Family of unknown function (DUF6527)